MREHYLILNRWVDEYAQYEQYVDHRREIVTYITTIDSSRGVSGSAAAVEIVESTENFDEVLWAADRLATKFSRPTFVIALYEDDTICGARLREYFGCVGPKVSEILCFRDKRLQADAMNHANVKTPEYRTVQSCEDVQRFGDEVGYPVVIKPTRASSCKGIQILKNATDVGALQLEQSFSYIAQKFIDLPVYHVDGLYLPRQIIRIGISQARVGGGGIPFVWREIYNFDIMRRQFELSCGRGIDCIPMGEPTARAGWLLMQLPHKRPCKITSVTSLVGMEMGPYAEAILHTGQIIPLTDTFFEHVAGRFRFRGAHHAELYKKMTATINAFNVEAELIV